MENKITTSADKSWYAVYTRSRAEKRISDRLNDISIENYLPLRTEKRKWSDRIKIVETPLISCYIFVHIAPENMLDVLKTEGVVSFVKEEKNAIKIPHAQMLKFIHAVENVPDDITFTPNYIKAGENIIVSKGPLMGLKGEMVEYLGRKNIVIRLKNIGCALITIGADSIEKE